MKEIFTDIVLNNKWTQHPCGPGSTMEYTENMRRELVPLLNRHNIKSVLDLPCGDFSWMSTTNIEKEVDYIGADIVEEMISQNRLKYPSVDFRVLDLTTDRLPKVDLLFCRDCLLHLSLEDINKAFRNIVKSEIKYILLSNWYEDVQNTTDIKTGSNRYINFLNDPYNFGVEIDSISDFIPGFPKRKMLLWSVDDSIKKYVQQI
jgi:hypothetical protein